YRERIQLPSHVSLVGAGAEKTTIDGDGGGDVVTLNGTTDAQIRGFWLTGAAPAANGGATVRVQAHANNVEITRDIITGAGTGVNVGDGSKATVDFNTLFDLGGDGVVVWNSDVRVT